MTKVLNAKTDSIPEGAIFIGRPSAFGNPFKSGRDGSRAEVIALYEEYLLASPALLEKVKRELQGKDLVCYCKPKACHGDVLLKYANKNQLF